MTGTMMMPRKTFMRTDERRQRCGTTSRLDEALEGGALEADKLGEHCVATT